MPASFETGFFKTFDSKNLFYRVFKKPDARATLVLVHGHGEHSGRYEKFIASLNSIPISLAALDLRGNGQSQGEEVFVQSLEDYLKDVDSFFVFLNTLQAFPPPYILLGHSLGGLVSVHYSLLNPAKLKGLILSSPCLGLTLSSFLVGFNRWVDKINPRFLYCNPVYPPHLTHSAEESKKYREDPFIKKKISARLVKEMVNWGAMLTQKEKIVFEVPVSILVGDQEKIVNPRAIEKFYEKVQAPWKDLQVFKNFYHEIFHEIGQENVFEALRKTLLKMLS